MGEELLYRGERTQVSRQSAPDGDGTVVCKRALGAGAIRRVEHERSILRHLAGIPGVPALAAQQLRQVLVLIDIESEPTGTRLPLGRLVEVARSLAATVAAIHRAGVLHRDITPGNLIVPGAGTPLLVDYDLALPDPAARTGSAPPGEPIGTLGYLPPEQTGRLRLPIDRRSDLYGVGATLYALATGHAPFPGNDPLDLIRDTLVRVPAPPARLPHHLCAIVMRLLEKDPDQRYQSAEALVHDLSRFDAGPDAGWRLGERDFPAVLSGPVHLVGRAAELRLLTSALDRARGGGPAVLVSGPPGVGKSALVAALRAVVTDRGGWFATGKYDQFRTGTGSGGIRRALTHLAGQLLAEPEPELAGHRQRLVAALGPNAATVAAAIPDMGTLLGPVGEAVSDEPGAAPGRLSAAIAGLLRAVAAHHPVVLAIDDLQWASSASLRILDGVISCGPIPGLLIVATYRDQEVDENHPLAPLAARWDRDGETGPPIRLGGLGVDGLAELLGTVLRIPPREAAGLAELIRAASDGNPYASIELLNALRADGLLELAGDGWRWDADAVRGFVARHRVPELLAGRLEQLPEPTRLALTALACLGGDTRPGLLADGLRMPERTLVEHLAPAVAARMITIDRAGWPSAAVRFRHDLILRTAHDGVADDDRDRLQIDLARRLATRDDSRQEAAEQYLAVADKIDAPRERRVAAVLLHEAGRRAAQLTNYSVAEELMACADRLAAAGMADSRIRDAIAVDRHAALYCLGRLGDADDVYRYLRDREPDTLTLAGATVVQINSLAQRGSNAAAAELGLGVLRRLGIVPPRDLSHSVETRLDDLYQWVLDLLAEPAADRREATDPWIIAAGRLINRLLAPAFQQDPLLHAWLVLEAQELWVRHGVCAPFVGTLGAGIAVTIDQRGDYHTGYLLTRHVVAVGRERGYQAETAVARYMHLCLAAPWFEPIEDVAEAALEAREDLVSAGDMQVAGLLSIRLLAMLLDTAETLDEVADELAGFLAFGERTGGNYSVLMMIGYRQLIRALQGRTSAPGSFASPDFEETEYDKAANAFGPSRGTYHTNRALCALIFGDDAELDEHSAAALASSRSLRGFPVSIVAWLSRAISLARRPGATAQFAEARDWLSRRATDCPRNFRPLLRLVDAERAWTLGDRVTAAREFDAALGEVSGRPWHHALLAERAGLFHVTEGLEHAGRILLGEARDAYRRWGAEAKVTALEAAHPFLRTTAAAPADPVVGNRIDLMAVLRASQALSSETTVAGLQARVGDLLSAMTGATDVHLVLQHQETIHWYAATGGRAAPVADPSAEALPLAAIRYVLRTQEPLLVPDATRDDRFARDPYLAGLDACALLVVPVPSHNVARAVLVLENRRQRDVFSTDRLETVRLIAGQLAVSLDNALLHDSLESAVKARTADLAATNRRLADSERRLRSHFEHAAVGQVIHGTDDRIEDANPAFLTMIGTSLAQLAGTKLTDLFATSDRETHRRELGEVISDRLPLISRELSLRCADGSRLAAHVTASAVRDADGNPDHLVSIFQDISARREAEAARDEAHLQLAERNRDLEAANQLKSDLIGMLGHEINNPLAMILGYVDLALTEDDVPDPVQELITNIHRSARRLDTIVHEVLALVSIDAGRLTALPRPIRVADHIAAALSATATTGVAVTCPRELVAAMQPGHFDHILTNLISNAAKYGGGATAIVATMAGHDHATIEVHDEGPGVPADFRSRLFDRFARADRTAGSVSGTGLGLYIVRELAKANGGDVCYRPAPTRGSVFVLTIPLSPADGPGHQSALHAAATAPG
ncbi:AAA family ATPase [Actinoplanes sp. CA-142083]|uniref:AAA family ATPase n=1 Tax=Actinoplanes sp. CA-142083 TaxID=3239903 RepID=UPI003D8EA999